MVEVISVVHHFESDNGFNGLYKVDVNGTKATIFRNGDSWGALSHYLGRSVKDCIDFIRDDRKKPIEDAVNEFLKLSGKTE